MKTDILSLHRKMSSLVAPVVIKQILFVVIMGVKYKNKKYELPLSTLLFKRFPFKLTNYLADRGGRACVVVHIRNKTSSSPLNRLTVLCHIVYAGPTRNTRTHRAA